MEEITKEEFQKKLNEIAEKDPTVSDFLKSRGSWENLPEGVKNILLKRMGLVQVIECKYFKLLPC